MSQKDQGNKQSMRGEPKGMDKRQPKSIHSEEKVGSSDHHGVRFGVPNHPDKSVVRPQGE
jgi:hypothetical protein